MKRRTACALSIFSLSCLVGCSTPPSDASLIEAFYAHRPAHERLHEMLLADKQLLLVATWGVETTGSGGRKVPPTADISAARFQEYLVVLKEIGGEVASKTRGRDADSDVGVWGSGWAGDTRHIAVSYRTHPPANQVASLDAYRSGPDKRREGIYRHVDGNWYIRADW